ncbi:NUDIX domain-containing protein [Mycena floridula]|nr:NUDIX domain-containing protein [Mycena floridula]
MSKTPPIPRPSASLVIINERNEVLFVQRNPQARSFGGVTVFPGGNFDKAQDASFKITAIRETFEESGLLIATGATMPSDTVLDDARHEIHSQRTFFQDFMSKHALKPDLDALLPFTEWITPLEAPRRFHARFYVAFLPSASSSGFSSGNKQERLPKPDGGQEVISARFLHPDDALQEFRDQAITFMPPQFYILTTLSQILKGRHNTVNQRESVQKLAMGAFGRMVITPTRNSKSDDEGRVTLVYDGDQDRGGPPGRLHRARVKVTKGITTEIVLERNFDIFTEVEEPSLETKL